MSLLDIDLESHTFYISSSLKYFVKNSIIVNYHCMFNLKLIPLLFPHETLSSVQNVVLFCFPTLYVKHAEHVKFLSAALFQAQ